MPRKRKGRRNGNSVKYRKQMARKAHKRDEARERGLEELRERTSRKRKMNLGVGAGFAQMLSALAASVGRDDDEEAA